MDVWRALSDPSLVLSDFDMRRMLTGLVLAFVLGQATAWVYVMTHTGLSYSRSYIQSVVLLTIIVAFSMMVIGNNMMVAFGLIGALAVIRFRNILKDTRDTAFIFFALVVGMACGTGGYQLAVMGTLFFSAVLVYLHFVGFGSRSLGDGLLRFELNVAESDPDAVQGVLKRHCHGVNLLSQRIEPGHTQDVAYRLVMKNPMRADELVTEMEGLVGISGLSFVLQEEEMEL